MESFIYMMCVVWQKCKDYAKRDAVSLTNHETVCSEVDDACTHVRKQRCVM